MAIAITCLLYFGTSEPRIDESEPEPDEDLRRPEQPKPGIGRLIGLTTL